MRQTGIQGVAAPGSHAGWTGHLGHHRRDAGRLLLFIGTGTAAAILGGVSLSGGMGGPMGIAANVPTLAFLRRRLNGPGVSPAGHVIVTGSILMTVAIADGTAMRRRIAGRLARKLAKRNARSSRYFCRAAEKG